MEKNDVHTNSSFVFIFSWNELQKQSHEQVKTEQVWLLKLANLMRVFEFKKKHNEKNVIFLLHRKTLIDDIFWWTFIKLKIIVAKSYPFNETINTHVLISLMHQYKYSVVQIHKYWILYANFLQRRIDDEFVEDKKKFEFISMIIWLKLVKPVSSFHNQHQFILYHQNYGIFSFPLQIARRFKLKIFHLYSTCPINNSVIIIWSTV